MEDPNVQGQIHEILFAKESEGYKAYHDSGHSLHRQAVERMELLTQATVGNGLYNPEVMPITLKTA